MFGSERQIRIRMDILTVLKLSRSSRAQVFPQKNCQRCAVTVSIGQQKSSEAVGRLLSIDVDVQCSLWRAFHEQNPVL